MNFFGNAMTRTGLDIARTTVRAAVISSRKAGKNIMGREDNPHAGLTLNRAVEVPLPDETLQPSFKNLNIIDSDHFRNTVKQALGKCGKGGGGKVGVSLPGETAVILIRRFADLPGPDNEKEGMLRWDVSRTLNLPMEDIRISWELMGKDGNGQFVLMIVVVREAVLCQYEKELRKAGVTPLLLSPAPIVLFNFYAETVPNDGRVAFLSLFDPYVTLMVFEEGMPCFYKNMRKGYSGSSSPVTKGESDEDCCINDVDMLMEYYRSEWSEFEMERIIIVPREQSGCYQKKMFLELGEKIEYQTPGGIECMKMGGSVNGGIGGEGERFSQGVGPGEASGDSRSGFYRFTAAVGAAKTILFY